MELGHTIPVLDNGYVRLIDFMGTDQRIIEAARISYKSPSKGKDADDKLVRYLFKNKHTSPFEMCKITFNVKMPIFVMRQWVRHRMQNLNEVSARYTELPDEFYHPQEWRIQDTKNKQGSIPFTGLDGELASDILEASYNESYSAYQRLLTLGIAKEMARFVLPVGIYTECYSCWDINNLLKFFTLRDDAHAQAEIQEYAKAMKEITRALFPVIMEVYDESRQTLAKQNG